MTRSAPRGLPTAALGAMLVLLVEAAVPSAVAAGQQADRSSPSTAEQRTALRQAKMNSLEAPQQDGVESGLNWLDDSHFLQKMSAGWKGFHPVLGGFPSGSGQAFGIEWRQFGLGDRSPTESTPNRVDVVATAAASLRGYQVVSAEAALRNIFGSPINVSGVAAFRRNSQEDFYGFGPDSSEENRVNYLLEAAGGGGVVWWQAPRWLTVGAAAGWIDFLVGEGTDSRFPVVEPLFNLDDIPGAVDDGAFLRYDGFVEIDWRNRGNPYRGGFYALRYSRWDDQDFDSFNFDQYEIDLQQYLPFTKNTRVIALRARSVLTEPDDGQQVPFYLLPILGGNNDLRGFDYARFTDLNSILLQAEYRTEVWIAMDMALFVDAGRVAADRDDLLEDMEVNYGFGFRLKSAQSTVMRADFAFGGDAFRTMIVFENVFNDLPFYRRVSKQR